MDDIRNDDFGKNISNFTISGHSTKREWSVYLLIATPINKRNNTKLIYVGKVGDNRDGCNPVISRVSNHFSYNKLHSQIRNKIGNTEDYNYEYHYAHFGEYKEESRIQDKDRINELERQLNRMVQEYTVSEDHVLLNVHAGKYVKKAEKERRSSLVSETDKLVLKELIKCALSAKKVIV